MQIQTNYKQGQQIFRASSIYRKNNFSGNKGDFKYDGISKPKAGTPSLRPNRFPSLDLTLNPKSIIEVKSYQGRFQDLIPDEQTQMKLIMDMYPILKKHPKFNEHQKQWNDHTKSWEVLNWIAQKLNAIAGENWMVARNYEDEMDFHIMVYQDYDTDSNFHALPLSFLPKLKTINRKLHDIIISMVALIEKHTGAQKWDDGYGDMALSVMNEDWKYNRNEMDLDKEELENFNKTITAYSKGFPKQYLNKINRDKATTEQIEIKIEKFKPATEMEHKFLHWLKMGLKLLNVKGHLAGFSFNPDDPMNENENPLTPDKYICFIWDWNDKLYEYHNSYIQNDYQNYGVLPFYECQVWTKTSPQIHDLEMSDFPMAITKFFSEGIDLISEFEKL